MSASMDGVEEGGWTDGGILAATVNETGTTGNMGAAYSATGRSRSGSTHLSSPRGFRPPGTMTNRGYNRDEVTAFSSSSISS